MRLKQMLVGLLSVICFIGFTTQADASYLVNMTSGGSKYIYSNNKESNNTIKNIINEYKVELIPLNTMNSIDGNITNSNDNYITVMTNNINLLKKELYKE